MKDRDLTDVRIELLKPWPDNPRTITAERLDALASSIHRFGLFAPLVVWENPDGRLLVVGGNQRLLALRRMVDRGQNDYREIPVVRFDGTADEARAVVIRDNNNDGGWDWDKVSEVLGELAAADIDPTLTGFDASTIDDLTRLALDADDLHKYISQIEKDTDKQPTQTTTDDANKPPPKPPQDYVERRFAKLVIGNVRGNVPMEVYGRWLELWEHHTARKTSTDVSVVFGAMLAELEAKGRPWRKNGT